MGTGPCQVSCSVSRMLRNSDRQQVVAGEGSWVLLWSVQRTLLLRDLRSERDSSSSVDGGTGVGHDITLERSHIIAIFMSGLKSVLYIPSDSVYLF